MADILTFTDAQNTTTMRITKIAVDIDSLVCRIETVTNRGERGTYEWVGDGSILASIAGGNFTVTSLQATLLQKLIDAGKVPAGTIGPA